ncbi:MAG: hypothetical protein A2Z18_05235 [Armatimonadetes bacterium RBG_16_58_9]|nr:MAG: hypothetical protein A2Z18_05235 [Armatimonadetes bacterium RBG_16_58_9]
MDSGPWLAAVPDDGAFDYSVEDFGFWSASVADGSHNVRMRVQTSAFNTTINTADVGPFLIIVDTTPPAAPPAQSSILEAPYSAAPVQATVTWVPGPPDPLSGTQAHYLALGTSPTDPGSGYVAAWTVPMSFPNQSYVFQNLPAVHGQSYYAYVSQINKAGLRGPSAASLPMTVDTTPPVPPTWVSDAGAGTTLLDRLSFSWPAATEDLSGIADYQLSVRDDLNNWLVNNQSTGGSTSYTAIGLSLVKGRKYYGRVDPINGAGSGSLLPPESDGILAVNSYASASSVKLSANLGDAVGVSNLYVTCSGGDQPGVIYVEQADLSSGIRTDSQDTIALNQCVDVAGITQLNAQNELYLQNSEVAQVTGSQAIGALGMAGTSLGGAAFGLQPGITGGAGLNTIGLLVRIWGNVTYVSSSTTPGYFVLDDGSGLVDKDGNTGVRVYCGSLALPTVSGNVTATGLCSIEAGCPVVLLRRTGDWQ